MTDHRNPGPYRKQSDLTVPLDRERISAAAKAAIAAAIDDYPDPTVRDDASAQESFRDAQTMVRCPENCPRCECCGGLGMVTVGDAAEWRARKTEDRATLDLDEPGDEPPSAA